MGPIETTRSPLQSGYCAPPIRDYNNLMTTTNNKYRLPFGSDLSAGFVLDGVTHKIKLSSVEKVGAWIPETATSGGHYAEIEFTLEQPGAPKAPRKRFQYGKSNRTETAVDITNEHGHGEQAIRVGLDTDY